MAAHKNVIKDWLNEALEKGATHMLTVWDTYDHADYPVFVMPDEDVHIVYEKFKNDQMQRVMEVYDMSCNLEDQLNTNRVMNI